MAQKILLIDDDEQIRRVVRIVLQRNGFAILEAANGTSGASLARQERPDLILSDGSMPGMTGIETLAVLRGDERTRAIPFIFVTATTDDTFRDESIRLSVNRFLTKPIVFDRLVAEVKMVLSETACR